jgi:hypothetical protein
MFGRAHYGLWRTLGPASFHRALWSQKSSVLKSNSRQAHFGHSRSPRPFLCQVKTGISPRARNPRWETLQGRQGRFARGEWCRRRVLQRHVPHSDMRDGNGVSYPASVGAGLRRRWVGILSPRQDRNEDEYDNKCLLASLAPHRVPRSIAQADTTAAQAFARVVPVIPAGIRSASRRSGTNCHPR